MKVLNTEMSPSRLATLVILVVGFTVLENYVYTAAGLIWAALVFVTGTVAIFITVPKKIFSSIEA
ncbi:MULTISPECIES: hypothetical protein [unclassified Pseudomonas]|uniref:hypothetical protein n=1 Tax=unclassified Pseudomonas TaxID=196821 RepID=UPI00160DA2BC|nr:MULTISPECIES: hypothetical protein [unclassified Pseudomonas]MBB6288930.1 putative membrane protein YkgB [Pseudomonas sp. SJZ073]MBB6313902.1 putative membrane protein YkgB [Pseudomonas sp. JAI120]